MKRELLLILICFLAIAISMESFEGEMHSSMIQGVKPGISDEKARELLGSPEFIESAESAILGAGARWNYREKGLDLLIQDGVVRAIFGDQLVLLSGAVLEKGEKLVSARRKLEGLVLQETHESIFFDQDDVRTIIHVHNDSIVYFEIALIVKRH